jgi:hypothetical protein
MSRSIREWLRLPSRLALLLGVGALSVAGAKADATQPVRVPQQSAKNFGELRIWTEAGRIYAAEFGKEAQELQFGNTAEARYLRELLERDGATETSPRILSDRMILVGGGGAGFDWAPAERNRAAATPASPPANGFSGATPGAPPQTIPPANSRLSPSMSPRVPEKS